MVSAGLDLSGERVGMDSFLTPKELADILKVKPSTIYVWVHRGVDLPYIKVEGTIRFSQKSIEDWLAKREATKRRRNFED